METQKEGLREKRYPRRQHPVLNTTRAKMAADPVKDAVKKKNGLICSSILVRPHESLRAVQLFILTERLWFHHSLQATKMEFARFNSQRSLRVSLTWGK